MGLLGLALHKGMWSGHPNSATGRIPDEPTRRIEYARIRWHSRHGDPVRRVQHTGCRVDRDADSPADSPADGLAHTESVPDSVECLQGGTEVGERGPADHWTRGELHRYRDCHFEPDVREVRRRHQRMPVDDKDQHWPHP